MISESELKQYKEYGLHLIPLKDGEKNPESKFTGRYNDDGSQIWSWKWDKDKNYLKFPDEELLKATRLGVNHEACALIDVDCDTIEGSPFMSVLPDTLTVGRKEPDHGKVVRKKLYYANGSIKPESFKDHNGKTVIEILSKTQSWCFGDERIILNDVKPTTLNQEQLNQLVRTVKKINAWSIMTRYMPKKGGRDDFFFTLAGTLNRETNWNPEESERFVEVLAKHNGDDVKKVIKKIKAQKENLEAGKNVWGVKELSTLLNVNLPCIDELRPQKDSPKSDLKPLVTFGLGEFIERTYPPITYYLYPLSSTEQLVQMFGLPGEGKTLVAMEMGWCESQGLDFMDFKFNKEIKIPPPVLYVEGEMSASQLQERICKIIDRDKDKIYDLNNFEIAVLKEQPNENFTKLIHEDGRKKVELSAERLFKRTGIKPIIYIDNIRMLMGMFDEKDSTPWIPFIGWLGQMRARGYTVKFLHHSTNEGSKASGSGLKEANLNLNVQLSLPKDDELLDLDEDHFTQIKFKAVKWREVHIGWQKPFIMSVNKETMEWKKHPLLTKTQRKIKVELDSGKDVKNIIDPKKEGFSKANVYKVVKILKGGK